ncbi:MAG: DUF1549 domain-containing protein [Phycisphaera sp.]|nr:DUF1549 domain-containing protein [Phycisphaera sp.]
MRWPPSREVRLKVRPPRLRELLRMWITKETAKWTACAVAVTVVGGLSGAFGAEPTEVSYTRDIAPLLSEHCYKCHGPEKQKGGLRLDDAVAAMHGGDDGKAIVPGDPTKGSLLPRVRGDDPDDIMPPKGKPLAKEQIALLTKWIAAGADWPRDGAKPAPRKLDHWSFKPITRPDAPAVKHAAWVRNPIDAFVLARLEAAGLTPSPEADRHTLIRRLSLDLIGLPPTPEEADAFAADKSPDAYANLVDRLLASPRYGEQWASVWLDLARYADTKGYEKDNARTIWPYRDWVIDAYNADMPYDRFTIEQLAGDLLPNATDDQVLATAFHRNTMTNDEGGTDDEEFRVAAVKDRVDTTIQVWMGLTMGCSKCHSHKYDPITLREYYSFYALFNQTQDADRSDDAPLAAMPSVEQRQQIDTLTAQLTDLRKRFNASTPELVEAQRAWEATLAAGATWQALRATDVHADEGTTLTPQPDGSVLASGQSPAKEVYTITAPTPAAHITAIRLDALTDPSINKRNGPGRNAKDPNFVVSEFVVTLTPPGGGSAQALKLTNPRADFEQKGWPAVNAIDGKLDTGWAVSPRFSQPHAIVFDLAEPIDAPDGSTLTVTMSQQYGQSLVMGRFRVSVSGGDTKTLTPDVNDVSELAAIPADKRTAAQKQSLHEAFAAQLPALKKVQAEIAKLDKQLADVRKQEPRVPVMRELAADKQRVTHVQTRGNFLDPGDVVEPGLPAAFGTFGEGEPVNRLGVAHWLVRKDNPLTARVAVNRVWARLFGVGIVETEEDLGTQGTDPSHPMLLDWLASEYRDTLGWSQKRLLKTIAMSATYRQSSVADPSRVAGDPQNRLLSRGARFRLSAETVRDQALAMSGLLSSKMHGPSVMPQQPEGIWRATYSKLRWVTSPGEDAHRRALYTFLRRTSPYPSLVTFDASSREVCTIRRVRTNIPLQALVTLNDPVYVEAAGALAKRMITEAGPDARDRAARGLRLVTTRVPDLAETDRVVRLFDDARADYRNDADAAAALASQIPGGAAKGVTPDEAAAWVAVANVLLNLDEVLMRH